MERNSTADTKEPLLIKSNKGSNELTEIEKYIILNKLLLIYLNESILETRSDSIISEAFVNSNLSEQLLKKSIIKFGKYPVEKK